MAFFTLQNELRDLAHQPATGWTMEKVGRLIQDARGEWHNDFYMLHDWGSRTNTFQRNNGVTAWLPAWPCRLGGLRVAPSGDNYRAWEGDYFSGENGQRVWRDGWVVAMQNRDPELANGITRLMMAVRHALKDVAKTQDSFAHRGARQQCLYLLTILVKTVPAAFDKKVAELFKDLPHLVEPNGVSEEQPYAPEEVPPPSVSAGDRTA
ncbi:hypothetical protein HIM_04293 [Hirsutella minnesotensis 3608]|uniref:Uncharacterized protein n=1 Tax=Hirsutella minnesotensis 3608 TaxID=1043627 RepID=A0A0F7ZLB5_9HYPO|nr:hypothetical protein HIM_04293 [Hirsutella minnesotensis 3608]